MGMAQWPGRDVLEKNPWETKAPLRVNLAFWAATSMWWAVLRGR